MDYESNECITMRFPIGNKIFERFNNLSIKEQESVISLGLTMLKSGKEKNLTLNNEEWDKKFLDKKEEYEKEKKKMKLLLKEMKEKKEEIEKKMYKEIDNARHESRKIEKDKYENRIEELNNTLRIEQEDKQRILSLKWKEQEELRSQYDKRLDEVREKERIRTEGIIEQYNNTISDMTARMDSKDNKCKVASTKGKEGEKEIFNYLTMSYPKCDIEDVTTSGLHKGDIIIHDASQNCMVEVKNYNSGNVKTSEVKKFQRDIENNNDIHSGIFLSLHSGICNIDDWALETLKGKPVIYLTNVLDNIKKIELAYEVLNTIRNANINWSIKEKVKMVDNFVKKLKKQSIKRVKTAEKNLRDVQKEEKANMDVLVEFVKGWKD